ncbi:hypothetical protein K1719_026407 [Acacia pycnantha]|nr:hypothetical protein K1719_026407 [Acacia pycnantha]
MEAALAELRVIAMVEPVLRNFSARRSALIKALTDDVDQFYAMCDPNVKEPLCLYGDSNGRWMVAPPTKFAFPHYPQPLRGINLFRDRKSRDGWVNDVAHHSDLWLISLAFFEGSFSSFRKEHRKSLYDRIDQLPKVLEVVKNRRNVRANQVLKVYDDFMARRRALTRALTEDFNVFYSQCDPRGGNLCLFGDTNGLWRVGHPDVNVPPGFPQPEQCNLNMERVSKQIWRSLVARNSHYWILSVASFEAANNIVLNHVDRQQVDRMIHQVPTLSDIVRDYQYF